LKCSFDDARRSRLVPENLIEKELLGLGKRQVDLERFHIGLVLGLATVR
jgi:hypothetical protein